MTVYARPGSADALMSYKSRYGNFIGGEWVPPASGEYFENPTPVTGEAFCEIPRSNEADIDRALDAAHGAATAWGKTSAGERANILNKIADRIEANLDSIALAEAWDNGKPIRETLAADIPLAIDHFRYFAGAIRAQEGSLSQIDDDTVAYHFHEPLGVVGQIIPWNFPILMATWKLAPAARAGSRSPISDSRYRIDAGVCSAGLRTIALPAASAGASFQTAIRMGKFHGMICATTPSGSWKWYATVSPSTSPSDPSCARIAPAK